MRTMPYFLICASLLRPFLTMQVGASERCTISYDTRAAAQKILIQWLSVSGSIYAIYATGDLSSPWQKVQEFTATSAVSEFRDQPNLSRRFYRVQNMTAVTPGPIPNMVWIEPGTFMMGSPLTEMDRYSDEGPQTWITISQGFWMGN